MGLTRRLVAALMLLALTIAAGSVGYVFLADAPPLDAVYMTVITLSTVGYGEVVPGLAANPTARIFTMVLILVGMGILLYVVSTTTAFLVEGELTNYLRRRKMEKRVEALTEHVIVCGAGTTGVHVVEELAEVGVPFVVLEADQSHLEKLRATADFPYIVGDATHEEMLIQAGMQRARGAVVVLSSDKDNLFVTFTARQLNPRARIVARGIDTGIRERLLRAGANAVVFPNRIGGLRMVSELVRPHVVGFLDRMLRPGGAETWRVEEVTIGSGSPVVGRPLGSLRIPERVGLPVLAVTEEDPERVIYYPPDDTVLRDRARLVVLTERGHLEKLRALVRDG